MPKIIENLENRLVEEARKQVMEQGYAAVTIRSVAKACGVGVGTVYNYFPSKDALLARYMLGDWKMCTTVIEAVSNYSDQPMPVLRCIYDQLTLFVAQHESIVLDESAAASFSGSFSRYHALLREQLSKPLRKFTDSDFLADFLAEAMITWTTAGNTFQEIWGVIEKLF